MNACGTAVLGSGPVVTLHSYAAHMMNGEIPHQPTLGAEMLKDTIYCEVCWTNPGHAHIRDMPICSSCIEGFNMTGLHRLVYLDREPYETLDGQRMTDAAAKDSLEPALFSPRDSEQLFLARFASLVAAF
jgi:hypothetical protein